MMISNVVMYFCFYHTFFCLSGGTLVGKCLITNSVLLLIMNILIILLNDNANKMTVIYRDNKNGKFLWGINQHFSLGISSIDPPFFPPSFLLYTPFLPPFLSSFLTPSPLSSLFIPHFFAFSFTLSLLPLTFLSPFHTTFLISFLTPFFALSYNLSFPLPFGGRITVLVIITLIMIVM